VIVALVGLAVGVVGVVLAAIALAKLARMHRSYALLEVVEGRENYIDAVSRTREDMADLSDAFARLDIDQRQLRADLSLALRHVSVIRYDAFGDMGGRYSFSAAVLDDQGDGLVITSIHGRTETRTYLKGLSAGVSDIDLSPEEQQAVSIARGGEA
jgi:hypothetical protein